MLTTLWPAFLRLRAGTAAVLCVLLGEFLLVALVHRAQFASVWEFQYGAAGFLPTIVCLAFVFGASGALLWYGLERAERNWPRHLVSLAVFGYAACVAYGVGGGKHLEAAEIRYGFALGVGFAFGLTSYLLAPRLAQTLKRRPQLVGLVTALAIVVVEVINRFVLVRLYPAFHLGLALLALLLAPGVLNLGQLPAPTRRWRPIGLLCGIVAVSGGLALPAAGLIVGFDNFRILMLEQGALLSQTARLTSWLVPPTPPAAASNCDAEGPECWGVANAESKQANSVDLRQRDLLLITVDALRADHVGAYGYDRPVTPNIDKLARGGATFINAYAATPHTSYSVTSLMTGKYMRPLLLQGAGEDSDTWAKLLRTYGYRTAAFYPPAIFFVDKGRFQTFEQSGLDFEYRKVEFAEGERRFDQVKRYLDKQPQQQRLFLWVHLFGPHEPYEKHAEFDFGDRDIDRYDSEIAYADANIGRLVALFRAHRPKAAVILTSDHGEEFGEHGGRYHGTTVYEEQVRVPMILHAPGAIPQVRVEDCVQSIDLLPTLLAALEVPRPPRVRGRNLGPLLSAPQKSDGKGFAAAETETQTLLAEGSLRLVCARRIGACQLFDLESDPEQQKDISQAEPTRFREMRKKQQQLSASHGRYETHGLRAEGKGWPAPILRGVAGDGDAAMEIAELLDDADLSIRRKAAELLFELGRPETASALRLALSRAEDDDVRRFTALALTRLGEGAPLAYELAKSDQQRWRRLAALALAEAGDHRGADTLVLWWRDTAGRDYDRSRQILNALAKTRSKDAVWPLVQSLDDVRLRPYIAETLAAIGDEFARGPLVRTLSEERYQSTRLALAKALVKLDAEVDLARPLIRFLGVPDPLPGGLGFALEAGIIESIGGPNSRTLKRLQRESDLGVAMSVIVPRGGNGTGVRLVVRARTRGEQPGSVYLGTRENLFRFNKQGEAILIKDIPRLDASRSAHLDVPPTQEFVELYTTLPEQLGAKPGRGFYCVLFADHHVEIEAVAMVPLSDELPPPAPKPWGQGAQAQRSDSGRLAD